MHEYRIFDIRNNNNNNNNNNRGCLLSLIRKILCYFAYYIDGAHANSRVVFPNVWFLYKQSKANSRVVFPDVLNQDNKTF